MRQRPAGALVHPNSGSTVSRCEHIGEREFSLKLGQEFEEDLLARVAAPAHGLPAARGKAASQEKQIGEYMRPSISQLGYS